MRVNGQWTADRQPDDRLGNIMPSAQAMSCRDIKGKQRDYEVGKTNSSSYPGFFQSHTLYFSIVIATKSKCHHELHMSRVIPHQLQQYNRSITHYDHLKNSREFVLNPRPCCVM